MQYPKRMIQVVGAVALMAFSSVGVAAQEDAADPLSPAYVTWTSGEPTSVTNGTFDEEAAELRGTRIEGIPLEASDPRFAGTASLIINGNVQRGGDTQGVLESRTYRIANDDGAWTGTATYLEAGDVSSGDFEAAIVQEWGVLTGEGAYEGLIYVGSSDYLEANSQGEGVIYSISVPPAPDVPQMAAQ